MIDVRTLTDGGQSATAVARELAAFLAGARSSLEIALYDVKLGHDTGPLVVPPLIEQARNGVAVRLVFNKEHPGVPVPPPPQAEWWTIDALDVPTRGVPGVPDLMHHKYVIRDRATVLTGSTNWTDDSWSREENLIVTIDSPELAERYLLDFEQLWEKRDVEKSGKVDPSPVTLDNGTRVWPWFTPRHGSALAHRIASRIGSAQRRVRIASPVITSAPILGTLAQVAADRKVDLAGLVDATQVHQVLYQWHQNGNATWKTPALNFLMQNGNFTGKPSTPWGPGTVHDFMHAKVTVTDDTVFVGSFNLSHSGEMNAENVLEIEDATLAERLADWIDSIRVKYGPVRLLGPGVAPVA